MWTSIANLKENLNKITLDVHDGEEEEEDEEFMIHARDVDGSPVSGRRSSNSHLHSKSSSRSPVANGFDSPYNYEIEYYKAEIKKLQESEAEIKALSVNYAALLREKEDKLSRLNEENSSLKQNLNSTNASLNAARNEGFRTSANVLKGSGDQSPNRQSKTVMRNRSIGNNGVTHGEEGLINGIANANMQGHKDKELADLLEEKKRSLAAMQSAHELQIKQLVMKHDRERDRFADVQKRLEDEQKLRGSLQEELNLLKVDKDKTSTETKKIQDELNKKISETRRLQMELHRRDDEEADGTIENLKRTIVTLEKENSKLKVEKDELDAALRVAGDSTISHEIFPSSSESANKVRSGGSIPGTEMELSFQKLQATLKDAEQERDKALQELNRLKQHLLEKESEESEKMDEDSKLIEELQEKNEYQRVQILHLEKALKQAIASQEEIKMLNSDELQKSKEIIDGLEKKLASCISTIDAKNVEVLNLQTALGQYYAEIEAKERLAEDLTLAREESAKLLEHLKNAYHQIEMSNREKEDILAKASQAEKMLAEGRKRVNKLEEDNEKLRRALEHSMTRLNRMSVDSDYLVDRRIVIKLLVTYFQRNHSKEVLDLMVRMLGFSDEDKQRIGLAQQGSGRGVVRGVLGLPGRLVGGILGGSSNEISANVASEKQSFADLWVDFLLKETEEREKRESAEANGLPKEDQHQGSRNATYTSSPMSDYRETSIAAAASSSSKPFLYQNQNTPSTRLSFLQSVQLNPEFSTPSYASQNRTSQISTRLP